MTALMTIPETITQILRAGADGDVAIAAPDRPSMSFADLRRHVMETGAALNGLGIGRNDRVAHPGGTDLLQSSRMNVRCPSSAFQSHLHGLIDQVRGIAFCEAIAKQHGNRQDRCQRVGPAEAGNVRR